jgi:hypothetical protein
MKTTTVLAGMLALLAAPSAALASTTFDLEGVAAGVYEGSLIVTDGDLSMTITAEGANYLTVLDMAVPQLGQRAVYGNIFNPADDNAFVPLRFSFNQLISSITFNFGDGGGEDDGVVSIAAYTAAGALLGTATEIFPEDFADAKSLTLDFAGASYFIASTNAPYNAHSLGFDISAIQTVGVPEPSTWALMIAGFGLTGLALRRRQAGAEACA